MTDLTAAPADEIQVAAACNEAYALPLAVMLASLDRTLGDGRRARVHILQRGLTEATKARIERSVRAHRVGISWVSVGADRLISLSGTLRRADAISLDTFSRLLLPELLPPDLGKVVYLDCDLVLVRDLGLLWEFEVGGADLLAAAELDPGSRLVSSPRGIPLWRELGLPPDLQIFNAGVMVIDLHRWREGLLAQRAFTYLRAAGEYQRWYDQDGLNAMVAGRWGRLDPRWNVTMHIFRADADLALRSWLSADPYIVHFNSALKPWHAGFGLGFGDLFRQNLEATAWAGWQPAEHPRLARWSHAGARALGKRTHAVARRMRAARQRLRNWAAGRREVGQLRGEPVPAAVEPEIRLFVLADRTSPHLRSLVAAHLAQGADRALIAGPSTRLAPVRTRFGAPVHLFELDAQRARHEVLRRLLHRYGQGHWCLVLEPDELFLSPFLAERPLHQLCHRLAAAECGALACLMLDAGTRDRAALPPRRITAVARDGLSARVFPASFLIDRQPADLIEGVRSKVVLFRYRSDLLLASDLRAVHGVREAGIRGVVLRVPDAGAVPGLRAEAARLAALGMLNAGAVPDDIVHPVEVSPMTPYTAGPSSGRPAGAPEPRW